MIKITARKVTARINKASSEANTKIILKDFDGFDAEKEGKELGELLYRSLPSGTLDTMIETIKRLVEENG